jgi:hypothetical protein
MVSRAWFLLLAGVTALVGCTSRTEEEPRALVLRGFRLVDVAARQLREADVIVESGVVVARQTLPRAEIVDGHGAFLMPALWDLKASLWGNDSGKHYDELMQEMSFTQCLRVQLYYGVGHVGVFAMDRQWVGRELERARRFELDAAEAIYPDKVLCSKADFACDLVTDAASVERALAERTQHRAPFVYVAYGDPKENEEVPGVSETLLKDVLSGAAARRLASFVPITDWARAEQAVALGASVIYGLPEGPIPETLLVALRERGAAWAPALSRYLELGRLLGNDHALDDPFLAVTLRADVRDTYRDERALWQGWRRELVVGRARRDVALASVRRAAEASVQLIAVSDAGWTAGTFHGYSSLSLQEWLERAGLDAFQRLAAATTAPASIVGRRVGFEPGEPADFVALDADPTQSAVTLRQIRAVIRGGKRVERESLLPDLTRGNYQP